MSSSVLDLRTAKAQDVTVTEDLLIVALIDGRTISVPIAWYPRLLHGTSAERQNHRLIGQGLGVHWPQLDEDISVEGVLAGRPSYESRDSFEKWLDSRSRAS